MAEDISEESDYVIGKLYQFANKAISALDRELIEGREDHRGEASVINVELAKSDWKKLNRKITELINEAARKAETGHDGEKVNLTYLIMSYFER
ncbi:MAG: hypothetical protein C6P37_05865 [Caldibacillus debilis]|jgi:uncharacterized protein YajQ (UPF0234 family)|uniref:Uncharacterized protein n=3 Tax=Caldibacillus debilis TaxID=301148 RepID=A0A420VG07_9BACI|nr:hypothetical protein [Caldibacillus debilis]REJ29465.1 MAG: hypothetical protein C6P37_05865 [Caldibacillus debilis]RKO62505.1 hypothetical protein Cdeb_03208 [Caldibacillus debilis GB1]